jgi:DNA-binding transcriptional ArsR family regulator
MEISDATAVFAALGNETRLRAFRGLVEAGQPGMTAGAIARSLDVPPSTLTSHLAALVQAGLVRSWRAERNVFYAVNVDGIRALIDYLTADCCRGRPELCGFSESETAACGAGEKIA